MKKTLLLLAAAVLLLATSTAPAFATVPICPLEGDCVAGK